MDDLTQASLLDEIEKIANFQKVKGVAQKVYQDPHVRTMATSLGAGALGGGVGGALTDPGEGSRIQNALRGAGIGAMVGAGFGGMKSGLHDLGIGSVRSVRPLALSSGLFGVGVGAIGGKAQPLIDQVRSDRAALRAEVKKHRKLIGNFAAKRKEAAVAGPLDWQPKSSPVMTDMMSGVARPMPKSNVTERALAHIPGVTGTGTLHTTPAVDVSSTGQKARKAAGKFRAGAKRAYQSAAEPVAAGAQRLGKFMGPQGIMAGIGAGTGALVGGEDRLMGAGLGGGLGLPLGYLGALAGGKLGKAGTLVGGLGGSALGGLAGGAMTRAARRNRENLKTESAGVRARLANKKVKNLKERRALGVPG